MYDHNSTAFKRLDRRWLRMTSDTDTASGFYFLDQLRIGAAWTLFDWEMGSMDWSHEQQSMYIG